MIYEFQCQKCGDQTDRQVRVAQRHDPLPCQVDGCDGEAVYRFNPENTAFVLKGHGWPSHDARASKSMKTRQAKAKRQMQEHAHRPTLQPNFAGQPTDTWADAQGAAHDFNAKEKPEVPLDTTSYNTLVEKEQVFKSKPKAATTTVASTA